MFEAVLFDYFKKFQPNFKFVITKKGPILSIFKHNFHVATSKLSIAFFQLNLKKFYCHISIQADSEEQLNHNFFLPKNIFSGLCIFTCFKYLVPLLNMSKETVIYLTNVN